MEKHKAVPPAEAPRQDVDDLIFFDETDAIVSQR